MALIGTSSAGMTVLLDVLAQRVSISVISSSIMVLGKLPDPSFQRKLDTCSKKVRIFIRMILNFAAQN